MTDHCAELTVFEKTGGPLTKRIVLRDGKICSDSADCSMANGIARRAPIDNVQVLADLINNFTSSEAYARLIDGVPDGAKVVVRAKLNGAGDPSIIARTKDYLVFGEGEAGFVLLDIDVKDMPDTVKHRIEECGDLIWAASNNMIAVLPAPVLPVRLYRNRRCKMPSTT